MRILRGQWLPPIAGDITLRGDGEALFFNRADADNPILVGKENFWSQNDNGNWSFGGNYDFWDTSGTTPDWDWAGNYFTNSNGDSRKTTVGPDPDVTGGYY